MKHVDRTAERLREETREGRLKAAQQESVDEAVFMSQFLPRSLNQVADHEIQKLEDGEVEETYAHAVAALTGNRDIVQAVVARRQGADARLAASLGAVRLEEEEGDEERPQVRRTDEDDDGGSCGDGSVNALDDANDGDDESSSGGSAEYYVKEPKTPEELQAEKEAKKAARKANKKVVKEARSEKRKTKMKKKDKKKDKKKAINKARNKKR
eukprot:CAMPEP_0116861378 /NCGR_PEP_ID=MMETSP0418-20121206/22988_1 /TAXON_ID=1158023 /ORGANISM="Astrosyne radiata, Strain 13vi08-1A" /LENGTH=211 /DNA_ID=CAMNT_0004495991 /DNA_START=75 /DNA_END=710 /DNA_ORIENTATION=+